jgi:3-dehydroquinate dehydratase type I
MGISVVTWTLGITDAVEVTKKAMELGLDGIQYAGDHRDVKPQDLRDQAEAAGLKIIAIDPFNAAPSNPSEACEASAIEFYKQVVDFAVAAGAERVTLHGLSLWTRNCPDRQAARERLVSCCKAVDAYAQDRGVGTLYEVCNHYEVPLIHTAAECRDLMRDIGGQNMGMILDSFHMNIDERSPLDALRDNIDSLAIYHISDSGRGGIGSGHIDFKAQHDVLMSSGFKGEIAIEPVLPYLTPSTPPRSQMDCEALDHEIQTSVAQWRSYLDRSEDTDLRTFGVLRIRGLEIGTGAPKVVASITGTTREEASEQAAEIRESADVDMAEFRLDYLAPELSNAEVVALVGRVSTALMGKPLLVTFRSKGEGGKRELGDTEYFELYRAILEGGSADLIDIEMMKPEWQVVDVIRMARRKGVAVILSNHEFEATPSHDVILGRLLRQQRLGADILKIATMPESPADVITLMSASVAMKTLHPRTPLLTMAMGALGIATRLTGELTGAALTYASVGAASAPGQLEAKSVKQVLEIIERGTAR